MPALRALCACALAALWLSACAGAPARPPGAGKDFARPYLAKAGETFVEDPDHGLVWLGVISPEVPYERAEAYCARLPPHDGRPWRVPLATELAEAPWDRYHLPDPPVRIWTATPVPGDAFRRFVLDPYSGAPEPQEVRQGSRVRVLCVTDRAPG